VTRRIVAALAAAMLLAAALGGCGIPDATGVQVDGRGPEPGSASFGGGGSQPPDRLASGEDPQQFAINFLTAAAGDPSGAYERVKGYIAKDSQAKLKEKQGSAIGINVVRLIEQTPRFTTDASGTSTITIPVQQVGVLKANGTLAPPVATETAYTFTVGKVPAPIAGRNQTLPGLFVLDPPPVLLMSTRALKDYYRQQTIYFWNVDGTALVPDLRYLSQSLPREGRATEVLGWLTGGPADWLTSTAVRLPDGTEAIGNVPQTGNRIQVNLSALPGPDEAGALNRLATQLAWSLPDLNGELELKIRNQTRKLIDVSTYLKANPVYRLTAPPERFCVYAGTIHPLVDTGTPAAHVPIAPEVNRNVVSAALGRSGASVLAALVTPAADNRRQLLAGSGVEPVRTLARSRQTFASMSRPVWLKAVDPANQVGLVVADGKLYQFGTNAVLAEVSLPGAAGAVTAVGAALDGHRIAFIAGGGLYVAGLTVDGGNVAAGPARRLTTSLHDLTAVEWSRENSLVVAGTNARTAIYEITVDGALENSLDDDTGAKVTRISAYPDNPVVQPSEGRVVYEANGVAWVERYSRFERIGADQVAGGMVAPPPAGSGNPTAPFFFY
jgi:hypothetical protein